MATREEEILQILEQHAVQGKDVRLLNIYKGLPISYNAQVTGVHNKSADLSVNRYQATCLEAQRQTFLQSEYLQHTVGGTVVSVNIVEERVTLASFDYVSDKIGNRQLVRVQPADQVEVEISVKGRALKGRLADISFSGAGIYTGAILFGSSPFVVNSHASLAIQLPGNRFPVKMMGKIINVIRAAQYTRIGLVLFPDANTRLQVSQYVTQRQAEIQREIRIMYDMLHKLRTQEGKNE
ncbi:MAG: PilZ domain-containing protein [Chloroflexi bacterium]|nr:PilZ domain-containing protein [Chloroflexota bacterium]